MSDPSTGDLALAEWRAKMQVHNDLDLLFQCARPSAILLEAVKRLRAAVNERDEWQRLAEDFGAKVRDIVPRLEAERDTLRSALERITTYWEYFDRTYGHLLPSTERLALADENRVARRLLDGGQE